MKRATISELKNQLSRFLNYVKEGEPVVVLDRGHPIADIFPRRAKDCKGEEQMDRLESLGIIKRGSPDVIKKYHPPRRVSKSTGLLQTLLEERASSR